MAKEPQDKDDDNSGEVAKKGGLVSKIVSPFKALFGKIFGSKKILIGTAAALLLILGGAGYFLFAGGHAEEKQTAAASEEHKEGGGEKAGEDATAEVAANVPQFIDLPEMTINLVSATGKSQFLRVRVTLEAGDAETAKHLTPVMPRILDVFQVYMRELRVADIEGSAGVQRLKEELTKRVNQVTAPVHINGVLFKDMLVQ